MAGTTRRRTGAAALPATPVPARAVAAAATAGRPAPLVPAQRRRRGVSPVPLPLGSLVTAPTPATCPRCAGASVTRLAMTLTDGAAVTFLSCHTCETRGWYAADGAPLGLDAVLAGASRR